MIADWSIPSLEYLNPWSHEYSQQNVAAHRV